MKHANRNFAQRGFTLVEVIVVAVIVAALAAVAIPMYNGYVTSSRNNTAANAAGSVASFMGACVNQSTVFPCVTVTGAVAQNVLFAGPATVTCLVNGTTINVPTGVSMTITNYSGTGQAIGIPSVAGGTATTYSY